VKVDVLQPPTPDHGARATAHPKSGGARSATGQSWTRAAGSRVCAGDRSPASRVPSAHG
jgi:hypothetical protein